MKPRLLDPVQKAGSAESVYADKYQWLMRWALHFCAGDREMAEDLVQDTFMRMVSSWSTIRDVEHPERFLYTYLKYGFLRLRSADRRNTFLPLDNDFDLPGSSAVTSSPDLMEWQQQIRSTVDFLCWRKATVKSASLLLFRYFHGLFPSEIMLVARMSRKAVDESLASSKAEARAYVNRRSATDAGNLTRKPVNVPVLVVSKEEAASSTEDFILQLLQVIYAAGDENCLSHVALKERYSKGSKTPIDCWMLSHVVSCVRCFDLVIALLHLPPRGSRPLEDVLGYAPKSEARGQSKVKPVSAAMRSVAAAKDRHCNALVHKSKSILLIVNGERVASRDVSGSLNELTVDLRSNEAAEMIEIVSEQAILLTVPVLSVPPDSAPTQEFEAELSSGRSVTLRIEFNPVGMRLHVAYLDPVPLDSIGFEGRFWQNLQPEDEAGALGNDPEQRGFSARLRDLLRRPFAPWLKFALVFAGLGTIAASFLSWRSQLQPAAVLAQAVAATAKRPASGIQEQQIRITAASVSFERTLHTDLSRKLRPRHTPETPDQIKIQKVLESAHVAWDDPLSPSGFRDWSEEQRNVSDSSVRKDGPLLTVTTKVAMGAVREESLTLNAEDLHTVGRTVRFSDDQEIQIAELEYRLIPFAKSDPAWFESPFAAASSGNALPVAPVRLPASASTVPPTQGELDVAELSVLLAFAELHADGQERLTVRRRSSDILVEGLVAADERKAEIEKRVRLIPHTRSSIMTFASFEASVNSQPKPSSIAMSDSTGTSSPLEAFSAERHLSAEEVRSLHASLLEAAIELRRSALELQKLTGRFPPGALTDEASSLQTRLTRLYTGQLNVAAAKEKQALQILGITPGPLSEDHSAPVPELALSNAQLCFELISQQGARPAQKILQDLAVSAAALQRASGSIVPST